MDYILEILVTIVVFGVVIYFMIPWYKEGRDGRGKRSVVRGIFSIFVYLAFIYVWFVMMINVPQFFRQFTDSVILSCLPLLPLTLLLFLPIIFFYNYLKGANGKDIFNTKT